MKATRTAGIYARVSTRPKPDASKYGKAEYRAKLADWEKKHQDTENQLVQLRRYAKAQSWLVKEFIDHESGKHSDRASFQAMFDAAARREIDLVLVWALDRFTREGVSETFLHIRKLLDYGVQFESLTEPHFRTTGPAGELMIAIAAWIAKQERLRISERTKAGLAIARAKGRVGGRPARIFDRIKAKELRDAGMSWRMIEKEMGIAQSSIRDALSKPKKGVRETPSRKSRKRATKKP